MYKALCQVLIAASIKKQGWFSAQEESERGNQYFNWAQFFALQKLDSFLSI